MPVRRPPASFLILLNPNPPMNKNLSKVAGLILFALLLTSCGASKKRIAAEKDQNKVEQRIIKTPQNKIRTAPPEAKPEDHRVYNITAFAKDFEGTKYRYGGTTRDGMDCSGLVYTSFLQENIPLPRSSRDMAREGDRLSLVEVNVGDLLFFETDKNKKVINHVGLVVEIQPGHIYFIHSTSSRGVIISSLAEDYWIDHFVMARRVI